MNAPHIPIDPYAFEEWIDAPGEPVFVLNSESIEAVRRVVTEGWRERCAERGWQEPKDLSGACKFSSLMVKALFGGEICGNEDHQFNFAGGHLIDLSAGAQDVASIRERGGEPYRHDPSFFGNPEHLDSMISCVPRVWTWIARFMEQEADALPRVSKINRHAP